MIKHTIIHYLRIVYGCFLALGVLVSGLLMGSLAFVLHSLVEWLGGKKEVLSLQVDVSPIH
jgi:hypothetical protein